METPCVLYKEGAGILNIILITFMLLRIKAQCILYVPLSAIIIKLRCVHTMYLRVSYDFLNYTRIYMGSSLQAVQLLTLSY